MLPKILNYQTNKLREAIFKIDNRSLYFLLHYDVTTIKEVLQNIQVGCTKESFSEELCYVRKILANNAFIRNTNFNFNSSYLVEKGVNPLLLDINDLTEADQLLYKAYVNGLDSDSNLLYGQALKAWEALSHIRKTTPLSVRITGKHLENSFTERFENLEITTNDCGALSVSRDN